LGASAIAAGFQSLVSRAAVSLANNKGDLGKVLKELGSSASIKSLATSMVTAGLVSAMPVDLIPAASASPLWLSSNFTQQLQVNLVRGAMSAGVTVGSTTELTVLSTFRDQAGRVCREFEVIETTPISSASAEALACRLESGAWYVEAVASRMTPISQTETFTPASGGTGDGLGEVLKSIGAGPALTPADEVQLLKRGWEPLSP
jgi:hypothetical protein